MERVAGPELLSRASTDLFGPGQSTDERTVHSALARLRKASQDPVCREDPFQFMVVAVGAIYVVHCTRKMSSGLQAGVEVSVFLHDWHDQVRALRRELTPEEGLELAERHIQQILN